MSYETIIFGKKRWNRANYFKPSGQKNAITTKMRDELIKVLRDSAADDQIRAVILTGGTDVFCSGVDLADPPTPKTLWDKISPRRTYSYYHLIEDMGKPVIAAIAGYCLAGGLELACTCDIRLAAENAVLGDAHARVGAFPGGGSTQKLPRIVGMAKAKELIFSGDFIDAKEALRIGLVNKVVPTALLLEEAKKLGNVYKDKPPIMIKLAKAAIHDGMQMPLAQGLDYEAKCSAILTSTEDFEEGRRAFLEKRKPNFKGIERQVSTF